MLLNDESVAADGSRARDFAPERFRSARRAAFASVLTQRHLLVAGDRAAQQPPGALISYASVGAETNNSPTRSSGRAGLLAPCAIPPRPCALRVPMRPGLLRRDPR